MLKKSIATPILDCQNKDFADRQNKIRQTLMGIAAQGQALRVKHLEGEKISASQAAKAHCYDCMGFYVDGKGDCGDPTCALYPWMPYGKIVSANRHLPAKKSDACHSQHPPKTENDVGAP